MFQTGTAVSDNEGSGILAPRGLRAGGSRLLVWIILALQLGLGLLSLPHQAITIDEFIDVPTGHATFLTGEPRLDAQNAPLFRTFFFGAPLSLLEPQHVLGQGWATGNGWLDAYEFMVQNYDRVVALYQLPRAMVLLCGVALSLLVYLEARRRYGEAGGLLSLTLAAFCPNLLAHGRLATLDMGLSLFFFASLVTFAWMRRSRSGFPVLCLGLALGLAAGTKYTALILYPLLLLLALPQRAGEGSRGSRLARLLLAMGVSAVVLHGAWFFQAPLSPLGTLAFQSGPFRALAGALPWLPSLVPPGFLLGADKQLVDSAGYVYFLRGELSSQGWWYYFLVAGLVKLTLPALGLGLAGVGLALRRRDQDGLWQLALPALGLLLLFSFVSHKNIGFRYLLPALPLVYTLAGGLVRDWARVGGAARAAVVALLLVHTGEALAVHPRPLAYFNALAGGSRGGIGWLGDSNLDWGQELPALRQWMLEQGVPEVQLAYFGRIDPALYGIRYRLLRGRGEPGVVAVSASFLQGLPYVVFKPGAVQAEGSRYRLVEVPPIVRVPAGYYQWLAGRTPLAVLGGSLYLYALPPTGDPEKTQRQEVGSGDGLQDPRGR